MLAETTCPVPEKEAQRLDAVRSYEILDTEAEVEFDALARVAAHAFRTPVALIAMMDMDRLWFKSRIGLAVPELDRKIAFCSHTIMRPDALLVVDDLLDDQRFCTNPLVSGAPNLRFYAGMPITDPAGNALGTIAVIDTRPRNFDNAQRRTMTDFATLAMTALASRSRSLKLRKMAMTDYLTGMPNRARFDKILAVEISNMARSGTPFSILSLDLDGFKNINDQFGHAAGDEVLCAVAARLGQQIRAGETAARLGGDEFAVMTHENTPAGLDIMAKRLIAATLEPIMLSTGTEVKVGISVGIATCTSAIDSAAAMLAIADKALYEEKRRTGRIG